MQRESLPVRPGPDRLWTRRAPAAARSSSGGAARMAVGGTPREEDAGPVERAQQGELRRFLEQTGAMPAVRCARADLGAFWDSLYAWEKEELEKDAQRILPVLVAWEGQTRQIRCPFFRTRAYDAVESVLAVLRFIVARHKSIAVPFLPPRPMGTKTPRRPLADVMELVAEDFRARQYYVTGRLSQEVYADDCFFDSPDPDMPVATLGRYVDALKGLFDAETSRVDLLDLYTDGERSFVATWRLSGCLKLPWRPAIKPYVGVTRYELNSAGLICAHTETWSVSAAEAFASTLVPALGRFGAAAAPAAAALRETPELLGVQPPPPTGCGASGSGGPGDQGAAPEAGEVATVERM